MNPFYEELDHTADWTVRVWADSLPALFERAAAAMFELSGADLGAEPSVEAAVQCDGGDLESLLVAWLNELIYLCELNDTLYTRFAVQITPSEDEFHLQATVEGLPGRGHLAHIKAVTYWDLAVEQTDDGWQATVTFDT